MISSRLVCHVDRSGDISHYSPNFSSPWSLRRGLALSAGFVVIVCRLALAAPSADWVVLENCRLILNPANDGDSFHVSAGSQEYIFRLYLVDAPETEGTEPARLIEQAQNFEITVPQAIEVGEAAKAFTREKLATPFTVFTRRAGAPGRSRLERFYAFVQTKEGDLGEQLIRNGLARVHGTKAVPPGFSSAESERQKLEQLEDEARKEKIGGWGINAGRLNVRPQKQTPFSVFAIENKPPPRARPVDPNAAPKTSATRPPPASIEITTRSPNKTIRSGKLDINMATEVQLQQIPGIGPTLASRIIDARPFKNADDLRNVKGIGNGVRYEKIRRYFN